MSLVIGDLVGLIRADDSGMRRGLANAQLRMRSFRRDVESNLRELHHNFINRTRDIGEGLGDTDREGSRFGKTLGRLAGMASSLGGVASSIGGIAAKLGLAGPLAAGLVTTLANIAPAAALGVSAMLAMQLATQSVKLGMQGVDDAVTAAFDTEHPEKFNEALKKLSPSAQAFAKQVKTLAPEFKKLQQDVQEKLFKGLDTILKGMATNTLPVLRNGLVNAAGAMNLMAKNVGNAAIGLGKSGTLGKAISGANSGLYNLSRIPGQVVVGLTQVAAAAAPAFSRLTKAAGNAADRLSEAFSRAFASGQVEAAIEQAINLIGELLKVAANVGRILMSVFKAAQGAGGGFIGTLQKITGALADAFASPEVQGGLKALFTTMSQLASTAAPLLINAVKIIGQVLEKLGPPAQKLIKVLGGALGRVLDALGPVLVSVAGAVGSLVVALLPLIDLAADLLVALLPALIPLFDALAQIFDAAAPLVKQLADNLAAQLVPILGAIAPILMQLLPPFVQLAQELFPQLTKILADMSPYLADVATKFADLLVQLAPLVAELLLLAATLLEQLMPVLGPALVGLIVIVAKVLGAVADVITRYVIPALKAVSAFLQGDFSGAADYAKQIYENFKEDVKAAIAGMASSVATRLQGFVGELRRRAAEGAVAFVLGVSRMVSDAVRNIRDLPGKIKRALPNAGSILYGIGRSIISGLISGIQSQISNLAGTLGGITNMIPNWKGPESVDKKLLVPAGQSLMGGLMRGIAAQVPALRDQLQGITGQLPGMTMGPMSAAGAGANGAPERLVIEFAGPEEVRRLIRGITRVDGRGSAQVAFGQAGR